MAMVGPVVPGVIGGWWQPWGQAALAIGLLVIPLVLLIRSMIRQARRYVSLAVERWRLSAAPHGPGYVGMVGDVPLHIAANAVCRHPMAGTAPPKVTASATGEILVLARFARPLPYFLYVQSVPGLGREHLPERCLSGDAEVDAICSILTDEIPATMALLTATPVRDALLGLHGARLALFEIGAHGVSIHGGHYRRVEDMISAAIALVQAIDRQRTD